MRNAMRTIGKLCFSVFVLVASALAQNHLRTKPLPAAAGPAYNISVGYTKLTMPVPSAKGMNLNGLDISGGVDFRPRWGLMVDTNYVRTRRVLSTPHGGYVLSVLGGPVFYPFEHGNTRVFLRALAGTGIVDGAVPGSGTQYRYGWLGRFSYAAGAGVEHSVLGPFSIRLSGDYVHTMFFDSVGAIKPQNNFRVTAGLVFRLKERQHRVVR